MGGIEKYRLTTIDTVPVDADLSCMRLHAKHVIFTSTLLADELVGTKELLEQIVHAGRSVATIR